MVPDNSPATGLLGDDDPPVVEIIRERALYPVLLLCDHASNGVPAALDGLGGFDAVGHRVRQYTGVTLCLLLIEPAPQAHLISG